MLLENNGAGGKQDASDALVKSIVPQDWETLVSPGHILSERIKIVGTIGLPFAVVLTGAALWGMLNPFAADFLPDLPSNVRTFLMGDSSRWTDLGDGQQVDYTFAWLTQLPEASGLNSQGWTDLVEAVKVDEQAFGSNASEWKATAELAVAPKITRPEKALADHADRLGTGVVSVPTNGGYVQVVARVDGNLALAAVSRGNCATVIGASIEGCQVIPFSEFSESVTLLKPQSE